jgi:phosphatidylglycerophosphatase A
VSTADLSRAFRERPIASLVSTVAGVGLSPLAPGTLGSAVGIALAWGFNRALSPSHAPSIAASVGLLASGLAIGIAGAFAATRMERAMRAHDPGCIVVDELCGQLLACAPLPLFRFATPRREHALWVAAFLLFRLFDIWKPGPVDDAQQLREGWGVVMDDAIAGLFAGVLVAIAGFFFAA